MSHVSEENIKHGGKHKAFEFDFRFFELKEQKNCEKGIRKQGICPNTKIGRKNIYTLKGNDCHQWCSLRIKKKQKDSFRSCGKIVKVEKIKYKKNMGFGRWSQINWSLHLWKRRRIRVKLKIFEKNWEEIQWYFGSFETIALRKRKIRNVGSVKVGF